MASRARRVATAAVLLLIAAASVFAAWLLVLDPTDPVASAPQPATIAIHDRNGVLLYEALDPWRGKAGTVPLPELPPHLLGATIATEDASFYSNPGVDPLAIVRAVVQNVRGEGVVSGGSTLTQQLVRNLWMSPEERRTPTLGRKVREALLALRLSARLGKDEILSIYLGSAPYGHQAVGVEAAARIYFGKSARHLDLAECALLAGLPQAPSLYDPYLDPARALARRDVVLSLMVKHGFLGETEAATAAREPLRLAPAAFPLRAPHFVAHVRGILVDQLGLDPIRVGALRVHTTLDLGLQEVAEATVRRHVAGLVDRGVTNGALAALDPATGYVLAMVGSADYFDAAIDGQVNVALSARQPGSALKPFLYGAALEQGVTAATVLYDVPTTFVTADGKGYAPENYDRRWRGPVSVRESLANSLNLPAVALLQRIGVGAFLAVAGRAGLASLGDKLEGDLSLALGSGEVSLLELTTAYAALAAGGNGRDAVAILRVENSQGRLLYEAKPGTGRRVVSLRIAHLLTSILSDDEARAAAFGTGSPLKLSRPAAAKTGTTTDWRDNWTVGYTPDLAAGVWVGNADNRPMREVSGIAGAGPIWHDFMEEALKGRPAVDFAEPAGLVRAEVCPDSGELPGPWCPHRRVELFAQGTVPSTICSWHRAVRIDRSTGLLAAPGCPEHQVEEQPFMVVPPELQAWARELAIPQPPIHTCPAHGPSSPAEGSSPRLVITSPSTGSVVRVSPELPLSLQRLEVLAAGSGLGDGTRVELRMDGTTVATFDAPPYRATWPISPGRHTFQAAALDRHGRVLATDQAAIVVEGVENTP